MKPDMNAKNQSRYPAPVRRKLHAFAFDPSLDISLDTAMINRIVLEVPWERLEPGPVGEYLEIVDIDPASGFFYAPIDLDDRHLLAQAGLRPAEGNPQFHQQMVYAVASATIEKFEQALGRPVIWAVPRHPSAGEHRYQYLQRLRIYPHALREANAYYSPVKKALLFGYFTASISDPGNNLPGGIVFTCLSHDIIAHEVSHALLESLHPRFIEPSNVDVLALHEAFADIVALFQHFSYPEVLHHQIARTRGDLSSDNLLGELAQQFGQAIGIRGALRSYIGETDRQTGEWRRKRPDPNKLRTTTTPHDRGAILVAAVFDAFLTIYRARVSDLIRIATGGSGVLPSGEIHLDLVNRLAKEAAKSAGHILRICIRAMDYCPPVDVNYGDYLRALITADMDMMPDDHRSYRLAFIEAFRQHGIYPAKVRSLSENSLVWQSPDEIFTSTFKEAIKTSKELAELISKHNPNLDRKSLFEQSCLNQARLYNWLTTAAPSHVLETLGLNLSPDAPGSFFRKNGTPTLEVHSVRPAYRVGPNGRTIDDLVIEITQRRRGYYDVNTQVQVDKREIEPPPQDFIFRGGTTLLLDLESGAVRYAIRKRINSEQRLDAMRKFLNRDLNPTLRMTYFGDNRRSYFQSMYQDLPLEPFAMLHRDSDFEEEIG
jgi:hypothetical protein